MKKRWAWLCDLVSLTKPRIVFMQLLMTAVGANLAPHVDGVLLAYTLFGTWAIIGSASIFNMVMEKDVDQMMIRTCDRPIPRGRISAQAATGFGVGLGVFGVAILATCVGWVPTVLAVLGWVLYVGAYTPLKRISPWFLFVGAVPGAIPPLLGFSAFAGEILGAGLVLFIMVFWWQIPHFVAIAIRCRADYAKANIQTVVAVWGERVALWLAFGGAVLLLISSLGLATLKVVGIPYLVVAIPLGVFFVRSAADGFRASDMDAWALRLFRMSLVYLPAVMIACMVDRWLG